MPKFHQFIELLVKSLLNFNDQVFHHNYLIFFSIIWKQFTCWIQQTPFLICWNLLHLLFLLSYFLLLFLFLIIFFLIFFIIGSHDQRLKYTPINNILVFQFLRIRNFICHLFLLFFLGSSQIKNEFDFSFLYLWNLPYLVIIDQIIVF